MQIEPNKNIEHRLKCKRNRFFEIYISKIIKNISKSNGITSNAKQQLNNFICILAAKISNTAIELTTFSKKKTISEKEILNSTKILIEGDILNNCILEAAKSLINYNNNKEKGISRQKRAGLLLPVSLCEKFLRNFGYSNIMITNNSPVFLASVLEHITSEILLLSINLCHSNKRKRVNIRDLYLSVMNDCELKSIVTKLNVQFIGGGTVPFIHSEILNKKIVKKRGKKQVPGACSIRDIKKFQKLSNCLIIPKFPFERFVRSIVSKYSENLKISKDVFIILQYFIEQYVIKLLKDSNNIAIHTGRVKLMKSDIELIKSLGRY